MQVSLPDNYSSTDILVNDEDIRCSLRILTNKMNSVLECTSAIHLDQGAVLKRISDLEATADEIRRNCQTNKECLDNLASRIRTIENRQGLTSVSLMPK